VQYNEFRTIENSMISGPTFQIVYSASSNVHVISLKFTKVAVA